VTREQSASTSRKISEPEYHVQLHMDYKRIK